jgi:hypothetical protein
LNFWNYKILTLRLHKGQVCANEKAIYLILAIIISLLYNLLVIVPAFGALIWYLRLSRKEKVCMRRLQTKEFLVILSCLFVSLSVRYFVQYCFFFGLIILISFCLAPLGKAFSVLGGFLLIIIFPCLFVSVFHYSYNMYRTLRTFSRLKLKVKGDEGSAL